MRNGMYLGLRDYFATRDYGIRYSLVSAPGTASANGAADYQIQLTNTGNQTSSGWQLQLHSVPAVPFYDGSEATGDLIGSVDIPDGLAPGQTTTLIVHAVAPPTRPVRGWSRLTCLSAVLIGRTYLSAESSPYRYR